jgi:hypothetical protein
MFSKYAKGIIAALGAIAEILNQLVLETGLGLNEGYANGITAVIVTATAIGVWAKGNKRNPVV